MAAGVAQHRNQEIRGAVDDLGLVGEIGGGVDKAGQLDGPDKARKIAAAGAFQLREQRDGAAFGGLCPLFDGHVFTQPPLDQPAGILTDLARDMHQIADHDEGHIIGGRGRGVGQGDAKFGKAGFDGGHGFLAFRFGRCQCQLSRKARLK